MYAGPCRISTPIVRKRVHWFILRRPLSPSFCIFWKYGTIVPMSWMMIEAVMYGMTPSAKIAALPNAPPEKTSNRPRSPLPSSWLAYAEPSPRALGLMPGITTKLPKR